MNDKSSAKLAAVLTLEYPVTWGSEIVTELHFRRINGKDLRLTQSKDDGVQSSLGLVARLCGMPPAFVDEMDAVDIAAASSIIEGFTESSRPTGDSGSELSHDI